MTKAARRSRASSIAQGLLAGLLGLSTVGHLIDTLAGYPAGTQVYVSSMSGVPASGVLMALNFLRLRRAGDLSLTWICAVGCAGWSAVALSFNSAVHNMDFRGVMHFVAAAGLVVFSLMEAMSRR